MLNLYKDTSGEWRWNVKAANGRIVANSGEGYHNRQDAIEGARAAAKLLSMPIDDAGALEGDGDE